MKSEQIAALMSRFESAAHREQGVEYWFAREIQSLLEYERWENFATLIERAQAACTQAGQPIPDHFREVTKMVPLGSGGQREVEDMALTRYACYLLAQNGDPRKEAIAFAQTYFAVQTRRQELIEARLVEAERVRARARLAESEQALSSVIYQRLGDGQSFARIRSRGDEALFGGIATARMKERLGVPPTRPLADYLPTITIKAKDFANEITAHNTEAHDLRSEPQITREHVKNNAEVRKALGKRGIVPEDLPAETDVRRLERRAAREAGLLPQQGRPRRGRRRP